jgi:hypothetical protein
MFAVLDYLGVASIPKRLLTLAFFLNVLALIQVVLNGTFIRKTWSLIVLIILFTTFLVSMMAKAQHWPYAGLVFSLSSLLIAWTYSIHFVLKKQKALLDILKLIWVLGMSFNSILVEFKLGEYVWFLRQAMLISFVLMYGVFAFQILKTKSGDTINDL